MSSNNKPIDNVIERRCPICGGKLKMSYTSKEELKRDYAIADFLISWNEYLDEDITGNNDMVFSYSLFSGERIRIGQKVYKSFSSLALVRSCEKCNQVWDEFDETDFVLCSNDKTLIQNYMSHIESTKSINDAFINRNHDAPQSSIIGRMVKSEKELGWKINLIKARLYQYQYKNQSDSQRNDDYNYKQLYLVALQNAEKYHTDNEKLLSYEYELRADMSDDILERFNLFNAALLSVISHRRKIRIQNNINELYSTVLDRWKQPISIEKRRIIFIANNLDDIASYYDPTHSINHFFTIDRIPASIKFPYGGPTGNELYIANPVKPDEYVPYDNYELTLLLDKTRELKRLLRSLGATEITSTTLRGTKIEEAEKVGSSVNAEAGLLGHKVSGGYRSEDGQNRMSSQGIKVDYIERLNSNEYPSLPDRLHWYNSDPEWKDIVEARLHHNQLHFEQSISTKQVSSLNEQSQENINVAYEGLISHINVNYHHEREFHVKTTEETMWRITAEFKPLSEFENSDKTANESQQNLSSDEQKYLDLVKKVSAGGMISELNRKMLEQIRIKLNISEEKAKDLEASHIPQLSEEEKQYIESVRQYLADGIIGENERVLLQTLRELNNISEERASELEAMA